MKPIAVLLFLIVSACAGASTTPEKPSAAIGETAGMCGGIAGFRCKAEGDFCRYRDGECRQIADAAGVCERKPAACTKEWAPVCGCDDVTYGNACAAAAAGASVAHRGACKSSS